MARVRLTKLQLKNPSTFQVISATRDTFTVVENPIHNSVSIESVTLAHYNVLIKDETDRDSNVQNANNGRDKDRTDEHKACIIGEFPLQWIEKLFRTGRKMKKVL